MIPSKIIQILLSNTNNSIQHYSFICVVKLLKYYYVILIIKIYDFTCGACILKPFLIQLMSKRSICVKSFTKVVQN